MRARVEDGPVSLRFESRDVMTGGALVIDVGEIIGSAGPSSKYVVVYRRQPDGSLRLAIDAASGVSEPDRAEWRLPDMRARLRRPFRNGSARV